jgi:hypothetical protein
VTTPPQRPGPDRRGRPTPPPDPATQRLPRRGPEPPTENFRRGPDAAPPTERIRRPTPAGPPPRRDAAAEPSGTRRSNLRSGQSILLIVVIVVAVLIAAPIGAELYARHRAGSILDGVVECVVQDGATVSFGVNPPFLWQHITGHYTNLSVETAGKRVQAAQGMTAAVHLSDIRLQETADSKGTIGSLDATLTWTAAGIKKTVAQNIPVVGGLLSDVRTDPAAGTIIMKAGNTSVTAKPVVDNGDLALQVLDVSGLLTKDMVQSAFDGLTTKLNDSYPLGIHADSVAVTDTAVVGRFSSQNASIPKGGSGTGSGGASSNKCFASL